MITGNISESGQALLDMETCPQPFDVDTMHAAEAEKAMAAYAHLDSLAEEMLVLISDPEIRFMVGGSEDPYTNASMRLTKLADELGLLPEAPPPRQLTATQRRRMEASRAARLAFRRIGERDGFRCRTCGAGRTLTIDHVIAVANGGSDDDDNFQLLCRKHNSEKGTS